MLTLELMLSLTLTLILVLTTAHASTAAISPEDSRAMSHRVEVDAWLQCGAVSSIPLTSPCMHSQDHRSLLAPLRPHVVRADNYLMMNEYAGAAVDLLG